MQGYRLASQKLHFGLALACSCEASPKNSTLEEKKIGDHRVVTIAISPVQCVCLLYVRDRVCNVLVTAVL